MEEARRMEVLVHMYIIGLTKHM